MVVLLLNSFKNSKCLTPRIPHGNYRLKNTSLKVKKHSSAKCARTNSLVLPVLDRLNVILSGEHRHRLSTPVLTVSSSILINSSCIHSASAPSTHGFSHTDYDGHLHNEPPPPDVVPMTGLQIAMSREVGGWPLYTIVIAMGQMLSATSFQITLLTGRNSQNDLQLYVLGAVFLAASAVWYPMFRLKPSVYVLSLPWVFFGLAFFLIGLPSVSSVFAHAHDGLANAATWAYAIASSAGFLFFGLNFGEEAVSINLLFVLKFTDKTMCRGLLPRFGQCEPVSYKVLSRFGSLHCGIGAIHSTVKPIVFHRGGFV